METEEDEGITNHLDLRSPLGLISFKAELLQLNRTQFSSLENFISKKVGN